MTGLEDLVGALDSVIIQRRLRELAERNDQQQARITALENALRRSVPYVAAYRALLLKDEPLTHVSDLDEWLEAARKLLEGAIPPPLAPAPENS